MQAMNIEERRTLTEPIEVLEDVPLDESNPEKFTKIGTSMGEKTKQDLVGFLKKAHMFLVGAMKTCLGLTPV